MSESIKAIAIHLPQFHPIPENDKWWGKGFTEWTNVSKAKPLFKGHYQPHLPADLGFYDLRLEESRIAQEQLAKANGIHGFCYYHYWFNGKRILEKPVEAKLKNHKEDLPFMLCWANENWTRIWNGGENDVLLNQDYSLEDDANHIKELITYFKDSRYIKVNGKPVFIVYRPKLFPDMRATAALWRKIVKEHGFPDMYLGFAGRFDDHPNVSESIFDFAFDFQPRFDKRPLPYGYSPFKNYYNLFLKKVGFPYKDFSKPIYDYGDFAKLQKEIPFMPNTYPSITPGWDNTARRKVNYFLLHNSTPEKYGEWLSHIVDNYPWNKNPESFLFINAWNEWAEGNHLEPCSKWGDKYLSITREILRGTRKID
jgi:lipopolysaccharide biosynthesis protein